MNNNSIVVGNDEGLTSLHGFQQTLDDTCTFVLIAGTVGTIFTGINDLGQVVGHYWNDTAVEPGLSRFHGFLKDGSGVTPLTGVGPHDVVFPTAITAVGDIMGYLYRDVQPDNSYVYQAFYYSRGVLQLLDTPTGDDLWLTGLNNVGQAVGVVGMNGVVRGQALLYDRATNTFRTLPEPSAETLVIVPTTINDHGSVAGYYVERFGGEFGPQILHQFLATPMVTPPVATDPEREIPTAEALPPAKPNPWVWWLAHRQHIKQTLRQTLQEAKEAREQRWGRLPTEYQPARLPG